MKIEYIRNLMVSHMVVEQDGYQEEWEKQMIAHSRIEGILFAQNMEENGDKKLWYDITGKQSLDVILEQEALDYGLLCRLLKELYEALEMLGGYLLEQDDLLLWPECIFVDHRTEQIFFCYYPGNQDTMGEAFKKLTEYLLTKLDHGDQNAVKLAYGLYERVVSGNFCLAELKRLIRFPYTREEVPEFIEAEEMTEKPRRSEEILTEQPVPEIAGKGRKRLSDFLPERYISTINRFTVRIKRDRTEQQGWLSSIGKRRGAEQKKESFVFEPDDEEESRNSKPTVLLSDVTGRPEGILRYEGKGACSDLMISDIPYTIGSGTSCNGHVPSATVSRKHARISRVEDIYFIEDLNSANGTFVGGELLNYKVKMSLRKNEIILFADEKFRFI